MKFSRYIVIFLSLIFIQSSSQEGSKQEQDQLTLLSQGSKIQLNTSRQRTQSLPDFKVNLTVSNETTKRIRTIKFKIQKLPNHNNFINKVESKWKKLRLNSFYAYHQKKKQQIEKEKNLVNQLSINQKLKEYDIQSYKATFFGKPGAGKSETINSHIATVLGKYQKKALTGNIGESVTQQTQEFKITSILEYYDQPGQDDSTALQNMIQNGTINKICNGWLYSPNQKDSRQTIIPNQMMHAVILQIDLTSASFLKQDSQNSNANDNVAKLGNNTDLKILKQYIQHLKYKLGYNPIIVLNKLRLYLAKQKQMDMETQQKLIISDMNLINKTIVKKLQSNLVKILNHAVQESEIFVSDLFTQHFEQSNLLIDELGLKLINALIKESETFLANKVLNNYTQIYLKTSAGDKFLFHLDIKEIFYLSELRQNIFQHNQTIEKIAKQKFSDINFLDNSGKQVQINLIKNQKQIREVIKQQITDHLSFNKIEIILVAESKNTNIINSYMIHIGIALLIIIGTILIRYALRKANPE